jgi:hypothetical protein
MNTTKVSAIAIALQLLVSPVLAQGNTTKDSAHSYQGGPKTEVPHTMKDDQKSTTTGTSKDSGGHHYQGGPKTEVPHHMKDKK